MITLSLVKEINVLEKKPGKSFEFCIQKIYANTCYFIFLFQQLDTYLEYQVLMLKEVTHIHYKHRMKRRKNNG